MKISIIVPVYNKIKYLRTILEQIKNQSFTDFECLLIDDGSTDGSEKICDEFAMLDDRFRVFHIPNGGVSNARNVGLDNASGEYITFIDADDQIHSDYLLNLFDCAQQSNAELVIGSIKKYWEDNEKTEIVSFPYYGTYRMESLLKDFARVQRSTGIYGYCVAKLIRSSLFEGVRFNPEIKLAEDLDLYLDIYPKVKEIYFDNKPYYYYLQAADNSSMLDDSKIDYFSQLKIQHKIKLYLDSCGMLIDENKEIIIERIYDYVYFSIFYANDADLNSICNNIRKLNLPRNFNNTNCKTFKKLILLCYKYKLDKCCIGLIKLYRFVKRIVRGK